MNDDRQRWSPWKIILAILILVCVAFVSLALRAGNQARQARFNVSVLQRFIKAYKTVEGKQIEDLSQLPDFHIISTYDSLSLRAKDIKQGILAGYLYDMEYLGDGKYAISASPVGFFNSGIEFGITEKGILKMNTKAVDPAADSYQESESWREIPSIEHVRTEKLPDYLQE